MSGLGSQRPLRRATLANGAPRHHHTVCGDDCGWRGARTADSPADVSTGKPCPRCGASVKAATT